MGRANLPTDRDRVLGTGSRGRRAEPSSRRTPARNGCALTGSKVVSSLVRLSPIPAFTVRGNPAP